MTRNELYEIAFRYKETKLWEKLWDDELFAIRLKNGEIGYICVMGRAGEHCALGVYVGDEGVRTYRALQSASISTGSEFKDHERILRQKCLQVAFEDRDLLLPDELKEVRKYARNQGIRLYGKNAFPQFVKYEPYYFPWKVKEEKDYRILWEAMEAAISMSDALAGCSAEEMGICNLTPDTTEIPLFQFEDGQIRKKGLTPLPQEEEEYKLISAEDEITLNRVKKLKKEGVWEAELVCSMEPVAEEAESAPYFPMILMMAEKGTGYMIPPSVVENYEEKPEEMLNEFAALLMGGESAPEEIRCRDYRTYALLKDFGEKAKIDVMLFHGEMSALDEAEEHMLDMAYCYDPHESDNDFEEDMQDIAMMILSASKRDLNTMPSYIKNDLKSCISMGGFPPEMTEKLKKKLDGII